jgi:NADP-dependent 3-hydroxy acid dehydrogenase YdfG
MSERVDLRGSTAIVTGASSGIGEAIAVALAAEGAHVYLAGRTQAPMQAAAKRIEETGGRASVVSLDVRDAAEVEALAARAVKETGRLDVFVNNAGLSHPGTIADGDPDQWREMLEVNVIALLVGAKAAIRCMRACGAKGHIVNVSSIAGRREDAGVYGATKAAVNTISATLRKELEDDTIRVVNVLPGAVATNFARNFDPAFVQGFARSVGLEASFRKGEHMPPELIRTLQERAARTLAAPEDVARAVVFAVTQPIELNIAEIVVRPQKGLPL